MFPEIVLPHAKPEIEWVRGRALQKMSPTYSHARLQTLVASALTAWNDANPRGRVGTEWRFRVTPPGEPTRPLVPDVAFLSYATLGEGALRAEVEVPLAAPTVAIEILSPDDRRDDVDDKIATFLSAGTQVAIVVDPSAETVALHESGSVVPLGPGDVLEHAVLPGFRLDLATLFARAAR